LKKQCRSVKKHHELLNVPENVISKIKVDSIAASVVIKSSVDGQIHYELTDKKTRVNIHNYFVEESVNQDILSLKVLQKKKKLFDFNSLNLTLCVEVPSLMNKIQVITVSGDIFLKDLSCEQFELQSTSGEVSLVRLNGQCFVKTVSGEINCKDMNNGLSLKTVSGDISTKCCSGDLINVKTVSGDIELSDISARMITFDTLSGDIDYKGNTENINCTTKSGDIHMDAQNLHAFKADSVSGDVSLILTSCSGLNCVLKTVSGDIDLDLSIPYHYSRNLLSFGDESCASSIKTISGDITIKN